MSDLRLSLSEPVPEPAPEPAPEPEPRTDQSTPEPTRLSKSGRRCAHCGSTDVMAGLDQVTCLHCGERTYHDGRKVPPTPAFVV